MNPAIVRALEDHALLSGQPRTWAALELVQLRHTLIVRLDVGPRWPDGRRELATITHSYYVDQHGCARYITYAHP